MNVLFPHRWRTLAWSLLVLGLLFPTPATAQLEKLFNSDNLAGTAEKSNSPEMEARLKPTDLRAGDVFTVEFELKLAEGSYTYSTNPSFDGNTKFSFAKTVGCEAVDTKFQADVAPEKQYEPLLKLTLEKHKKHVTWTRKYRVLPDAKQVRLQGEASYQVCDARTCQPLTYPFDLTAKVSGNSELSAPAPAAKKSVFEQTVQSGKPGKPQPLSVTFALTRLKDRPPGEVELRVHAQLEEGWHTYSVTQPPDNAATATNITVDGVVGLDSSEAPFQAYPPAEIKRPTDDIYQEVHHGEVTWVKTLTIADDATSGQIGVTGALTFQACTERQCLRPETISFALSGDIADLPVADPLVQVAGKAGDSADAKTPAAADTNADSEMGDLRSQGLVPFLLAAFVAGFGALLTPCVFPMVPITVSFFLKQSEKKHHRPVTTALLYCFGVVITFTVLGLLMAAIFGATSINQLANNPWLNLTIAAVLIFFGANLLGMFEIRIPGWLLTWTAGKEQQGGILGVLFMSLTFTLVSFTCTFAFAGALLVWAAKGEFYWPILGMLAFSTAFSLPFFFLALFPSFLHKLPKSGGWMNTVKVTMGLIEVGAAFKFFSVADLAWNPSPIFFDYSLVVSAWMVIAICTGLYLLGLIRLPHDTPVETVSVIRLAAAVWFLGFAGYLASGLYGANPPESWVWDQIAAIAPPRVSEAQEGDIGPYLEHDGLRYALDYDRALEFAQQEAKPVFIDFTGVNCVNCRLMEKKLARPQNRERLAKFVRVQLYTDNVPGVSDEELVERMLEKNRTLQETWFGDVTLPAYAIVTPDGENILVRFKGQEVVDGEFTEFLDAGLQKWQEVQTPVAAKTVDSRKG